MCARLGTVEKREHVVHRLRQGRALAEERADRLLRVQSPLRDEWRMARPVPVQMWYGPGADVAGVSQVPVQMWQG